MNGRIANLANLMKRKLSDGQKFVLMLGAGASLSSGVKPTEKIMEELVEANANGIEGKDYRIRFDKLWKQTSPANRELYVKDYLKFNPSSGYKKLAELMEKKFFDIVVTLNFDNILETALLDRDFRDFIAVVRGDLTEEAVVSTARAKDPRVKILKLHGSLRSGQTLLFSKEEMLIYEPKIRALVDELTKQDIIICGYAFRDMCMARDFSPTGGAIYCVDPGGEPENLQGIIGVRKSEGFVIDKEDGYFDRFFEQLHSALLEPVRKPVVLKLNPFKFLDSYETADSKWFLSREKSTQDLLDKIGSGVRAIHVLGKPKVGKTSLMRAGLIANLERSRFVPIYVRCTGDLEQSLPRILNERYRLSPPADNVQSALQELAAASPGKHVVLILDQFERMVRRFPDSEEGRKDLLTILGNLCPGCDNFTVVFVALDDSEYSLLLNEMKAECVGVRRLEAADVGKIIRFLADKAGVPFDDAVIEALTKEYDQKRAEFSLAHIQAICSILCSKPRQDLATYQEVLEAHRMSLNKAINECDVMSFFEDFPLEEQRALLRNIMKFVSPVAKSEIAESLRDHFAELLPVTPLREPVAECGIDLKGAAYAGN